MKERVPEIPGGVKVLGVVFQGFIDPATNQAVFSQSGVYRGLEIPETQLRRMLRSEAFKTLAGKAFNPAKLLTTAAKPPISVVTQTDLTLLVKLASEKGYPVAKSMQDASFAVILQQSIDEALGIERTRKEYLDEGAILRKRLEYKKSYHELKDSTFENGYGVRGLCNINRSVSNLAVPDAPERRARSKNWRNKCSTQETVKITVGNMVHQRAMESASDSVEFTENLEVAGNRTSQIYQLMDAPF